MGRKVLVGVGAAVAAGVLVGGLSRLLMRLVSLSVGHVGDFSWAGTLGIVALFIAAMTPGALLAAFVDRRRRWALLAVGASFLCLPAVGVASDEVGNVDDLTALQWVGLAASGLAVFATLPLLAVVTFRLVNWGQGRTRGDHR